jgi:hypothetical protein
LVGKANKCAWLEVVGLEDYIFWGEENLIVTQVDLG